MTDLTLLLDTLRKVEALLLNVREDLSDLQRGNPNRDHLARGIEHCRDIVYLATVVRRRMEALLPPWDDE